MLALAWAAVGLQLHGAFRFEDIAGRLPRALTPRRITFYFKDFDDAGEVRAANGSSLVAGEVRSTTRSSLVLCADNADGMHFFLCDPLRGITVCEWDEESSCKARYETLYNLIDWLTQIGSEAKASLTDEDDEFLFLMARRAFDARARG